MNNQCPPGWLSVCPLYVLPALLGAPPLSCPQVQKHPQGGFDKSLENMEAPLFTEEETDKENKGKPKSSRESAVAASQNSAYLCIITHVARQRPLRGSTFAEILK